MTFKTITLNTREFMVFCEKQKPDVKDLYLALFHHDTLKFQDYFRNNKMQETQVYIISHYLNRQHINENFLDVVLDEMIKQKVFYYYPDTKSPKFDAVKLQKNKQCPVIFAALTNQYSNSQNKINQFIDKFIPYNSNMQYNNFHNNHYDYACQLGNIPIKVVENVTEPYLSSFTDNAPLYLAKIKLMTYIDYEDSWGANELGKKNRLDFKKTLSSLSTLHLIDFVHDVLAMEKQVDVNAKYMNIILKVTFGSDCNFTKHLSRADKEEIDWDNEFFDFDKIRIALEKKEIQNSVQSKSKHISLKVL